MAKTTVLGYIYILLGGILPAMTFCKFSVMLYVIHVYDIYIIYTVYGSHYASCNAYIKHKGCRKDKVFKQIGKIWERFNMDTDSAGSMA